MPLATRADLEVIRGLAYLEALLKGDGTITPPERVARLEEALEQGDLLIARFLPLERFIALPVGDKQRKVVAKFAIAEAMFWLRSETNNKFDDIDYKKADQRRAALAKMRDRSEWPGGSGNQRNVRAESGPSESDFSQRRMRGLT